MLNRVVFTVKILARITPLFYYNSKIPVKSFLVELVSKAKKKKKLKLRLKIAGRLGDDSLFEKAEYFIVEGNIATSIVLNSVTQQRKKIFEINVSRLHSVK